MSQQCWQNFRLDSQVVKMSGRWWLIGPRNMSGNKFDMILNVSLPLQPQYTHVSQNITDAIRFVHTIALRMKTSLTKKLYLADVTKIVLWFWGAATHLAKFAQTRSLRAPWAWLLAGSPFCVTHVDVNMMNVSNIHEAKVHISGWVVIKISLSTI